MKKGNEQELQKSTPAIGVNTINMWVYVFKYSLI